MRHTSPLVSSAPIRDGAGRSFGIVSSFPPTACGIATFSAALAAGLIANGDTVDVVRCGTPPEMEDPLVVAALGDASTDVAAAIDELNRVDVAIIQHEYGIYDGQDGDDVLELMAGVAVPSIVVAHTVVREPTASQRRVLEAVCAASDAVVVMTASAYARLIEGFDVDPSKISVIPHGAATPLDEPPQGGEGPSLRPPQLLTWGLLGPGKGIEWAIDALASLDDLRPRPTYLVAGSTHPKVLARSGDSYRRMLVDRAQRAGVGPSVTFDDVYRDLSALTDVIRAADLVVLPYDSEDQVTSGVLVDAVAAGRPVVSTAFPHAVELLSSGAGLVVPQRDPAALADAIRSVLTDPDLAAAMAAEARRLAPDLSWSAIARQYGDLAGQLHGASWPVRT